MSKILQVRIHYLHFLRFYANTRICYQSSIGGARHFCRKYPDIGLSDTIRLAGACSQDATIPCTGKAITVYITCVIITIRCCTWKQVSPLLWRLLPSKPSLHKHNSPAGITQFTYSRNGIAIQFLLKYFPKGSKLWTFVLIRSHFAYEGGHFRAIGVTWTYLLTPPISNLKSFKSLNCIFPTALQSIVNPLQIGIFWPTQSSRLHYLEELHLCF